MSILMGRNEREKLVILTETAMCDINTKYLGRY